MVIVKYILENEDDPLYEINPIFRNTENEDKIYFNSDNENKTKINLNDEIIERKIKNVNKDSNEFIKEKQFLKIQEELKKK